MRDWLARGYWQEWQQGKTRAMGSYQSLIRKTAEPVRPEVDSLLGEEVSLFNPDRTSSAIRELTLSSQSEIKIRETVKNARDD